VTITNQLKAIFTISLGLQRHSWLVYSYAGTQSVRFN